MTDSISTPKNKTITRKPRWRTILAIFIVAVIAFAFVFSFIDDRRTINSLHKRGDITKVEMKVVSAVGTTNVILTDKKQLDSIDNALQAAKEIKAQKGGVFDPWADITVYKDDKKIHLSIEHSPYNGWMIDVGGKTLGNEYLFELVRRYSGK
jgi:hypothetical protein